MEKLHPSHKDHSMENPFLKQYTSDKTDIQLVEEAKKGNKKSLEKLLLKHQPYIYNIAWKMVRNARKYIDEGNFRHTKI